MSDFIVGNSSLGTSSGYIATSGGYQEAKADIQRMLAAGQQPNVDRATLKNIEYVAGPFTSEEKRKLSLF